MPVVWRLAGGVGGSVGSEAAASLGLEPNWVEMDPEAMSMVVLESIVGFVENEAVVLERTGLDRSEYLYSSWQLRQSCLLRQRRSDCNYAISNRSRTRQELYR